MDSAGTTQIVPPTEPLVCPYCHQPVSQSFFYCPNCGHKLSLGPLSTSVQTQIGLYVFSAILPFIAYIAIGKWEGFKYYRSKDPKAKLIGTVAVALLVLSTLYTIYLAYSWTQQAIQDTQQSLNADFNY